MSLLLLFNQPASVTTYLSDSFTGTNGDPWDSSKWTMYAGTQTIQGNRGAMLTPGGYGSSFIEVDPAIPANFSFTGQVQFPSTDSTLAIEYRNNGTDYYRAYVTPAELTIYTTPWPTIVATTSISTSLTDLVNFRLEVDGTSHKLRFWLNSDPEPSTWNINTTNSATTATPTVPMRLFFGDPNSVTGYLDNVSITSVGGGATTVSRAASGSGAGAASALALRTAVRTATGSSTSSSTAARVLTALRTATGAGLGAGTATPGSSATTRTAVGTSTSSSTAARVVTALRTASGSSSSGATAGSLRTAIRSASGPSTSSATATSVRTVARTATGSGVGSGTGSTGGAIKTRTATGSSTSSGAATRLCTRVRSAAGAGSSSETAARLRSSLRSATGPSASGASTLSFKSARRTASALGSSSAVATPGLLIITAAGRGTVIVWYAPVAARWQAPAPLYWREPSVVTDAIR